jgi:hypothetical protein
MSFTRDREELHDAAVLPNSHRNAGRGTIFLALVALLLTVLFVRIRLMESFARPAVAADQSAVPTWKVSACALVRDDRIAEGQSIRLTLLGSSTIHATVWDTKCRIPLGTEFRRDGDFMCNPSVAGPYDSGCFGIDSETGR